MIDPCALSDYLATEDSSNLNPLDFADASMEEILDAFDTDDPEDVPDEVWG